jgi:thioredoxin-related protein
MGNMRLCAVLILLCVLIIPSSLSADTGDIPVADNLAEIGQLSRQQEIPVIIFVTRDACPYCRTLRDKILQPMLAANKFEHRAILVEVNLDRVEEMTGFDNSKTTAGAFAKHYGAEITPTLLFLNAEGQEMSKRRVGISNLEFYGHYLQKSIDKATNAIRLGVPQGE